ncbi:Hypothetical predicted protein [Podarcis lilfordi]|uniref:Uncharacterized protein n=1 Tax=Podarcis lilfordi TaxID=74358 RepID=A0AA35KFH6_9SAUR|nr:Hypothetical predicted protein [Podarcis lilfordi]
MARRERHVVHTGALVNDIIRPDHQACRSPNCEGKRGKIHADLIQRTNLGESDPLRGWQVYAKYENERKLFRPGE